MTATLPGRAPLCISLYDAAELLGVSYDHLLKSSNSADPLPFLRNLRGRHLAVVEQMNLWLAGES